MRSIFTARGPPPGWRVCLGVHLGLLEKCVERNNLDTDNRGSPQWKRKRPVGKRKHHLMKLVRELREARGWTILDLAVRSKVSRDTIWRTENGLSCPQDQTLRRLARAFNVRIAELAPERGCWEERGAQQRPTIEQVMADAQRRPCPGESSLLAYLRSQGVEV